MKENKIIAFLIIAILIALTTDFLLIYCKKNEKNREKLIDKNDEIGELYKCSGNHKDLQFAILDDYYQFEYQNGIIKNQKQEYVFQFVNQKYYNQIGKKELFKEGFFEVEETTENENLKKIYSKNIGNANTIENTELETFINKLKKNGYSCRKE